MYSVLHLGLSYACNMCCKHCFVERKTDFLSYDKTVEVLDELCEQGLMMLYYTYGEPLLSGIFFDVVKYAASKGLIQILMTNGSLITEQNIEYIKNSGISNVYVSIDSSDYNEHDENRGLNGAFDAAINSIKLMKKQGINVGLSTAVTEMNAMKLKGIYEIALKEDIKIVSFLRARENGTMISLSDDAQKAYKDFVQFGIKQKAISFKIHDLELLPVLTKWRQNDIITEEEYEKYYGMCCCHASTTVSIAPNGDVSNCNLINNNLGNLSCESIRSILERNKKDENIICCTTISK